jgi:hypothetical protein
MRGAAAAVLAAAVLALAAPAAASKSPWNPGWCTASQDASGHLSVTGGGLLASYAYDWEIYAQGAGSYPPPLDSGQFTSNPDGTFTFTSPQAVAWYLGQAPATPGLGFAVEHGMIHAHQYDQEIAITECGYP